MSYAEDVRQYCITTIVEPARSAGVREVSIRVGDVHHALGYKHRHPLVCAALRATLFEESGRVKRVADEGPRESSTTVLNFAILP